MKKQIFTLIASVALIGSINAQAPRKVVVEDYTGIWCGWCPLGRTCAEHLESKFGAKVINIGMHSGTTSSDYLAGTYSNELASIVTGFPSGVIDRTKTGGAMGIGIAGNVGDDWDAAVTARLNKTAPLTVGVASTYNSSTRAVSITVTANFVAMAMGNMRFNCVLIEDSINTDGKQANYMNTAPDGTGTPWLGKGDPITKYFQRHTARINLAATSWGDAGIIPNMANAGQSFNKTYSYTIPAAWNTSHIKIVGFVSSWGTGTTPDLNNISILNAEVVRLGSSSPTTYIAENTEKGFSVGNAYPSPFSSVVSIPLQLSENTLVNINVYNTLGVLVNTLVDRDLIPGEHTFFWAGDNQAGDKVSNGIYICKVTTNRGSVSKTLMLNR